ncbi:hypothetical protein [Promicromonospora soli]
MTVLVAYNESPQGEAAMRAAVSEAVRRRQELAVLVLTPQVGTTVPAALAHLLDSVPNTVPLGPISFRAEQSDVADAIVDRAEAVAADSWSSARASIQRSARSWWARRRSRCCWTPRPRSWWSRPATPDPLPR